MQPLEGPIGPRPFGDVALRRDVLIVCVEGDIGEGDNEEVEAVRSQGLADEADSFGGVLAAERWGDAREVEQLYCTNTAVSALILELLSFSVVGLHTGDIVLSPLLDQHLRVADGGRDVGHAVRAHVNPLLRGQPSSVAVGAAVGGAAGRDGGGGGGFEVLTQRIDEFSIGLLESRLPDHFGTGGHDVAGREDRSGRHIF